MSDAHIPHEGPATMVHERGEKRPTGKEIRFSPTPAQTMGLSVLCPDCPAHFNSMLQITPVGSGEIVPYLECGVCGSKFNLPMVDLERRDEIEGG